MKTIIKIVTFTLTLSFAIFGCDRNIGDSCSRDFECSEDGDRTCDSNQPGGYCLIITCTPDQCPSGAVCVEFTTPSPTFDDDQTETESYYDQLAPNRTRTYCLEKCKKDSDCRDAYHCAIDDELNKDLNGLIIDSKFEGLGACVPDIK